MGSQDCNREPEKILTEAIEAGITAFQYREKGANALTGKQQIELGKRLRDICYASTSQEFHAENQAVPFICFLMSKKQYAWKTILLLVAHRSICARVHVFVLSFYQNFFTIIDVYTRRQAACMFYLHSL